MKRIYLDNNATTPLVSEVIGAMKEVLALPPMNPSSVHSLGQQGKKLLMEARHTFAEVLKVQPKEVIFTSSGTEALNFLIRGFYSTSLTLQGVPHIISSNVEHPAVQKNLQLLEMQGAMLTYLPAGSWGAIRPEQLKEAISEQTRLIVLTAVNNVTGVKSDFVKIAEVALECRIPLIVDGVQLLGKELFTIPPGVSGMAFSGHKLHAPAGIGAAFLRSSFPIPSLMIGGEQEYGKRGGTENLLGIVGFAKAVELLSTCLPRASERMEKLRKRLIEGLQSKIGNLILHGEGPHICNTVHIGFPGVHGETLLIQLDLLGVVASHGSACSSGSLEPSSVLINMGIAPQLAQGSLRFSLSRMNTEEEIEESIRLISQAVLSSKSKEWYR